MRSMERQQTLFSDGEGGGLPVVLRPETGGLRLGSAEAPFSLADLPVSSEHLGCISNWRTTVSNERVRYTDFFKQAGEDLVLRIFVDKHMVEVFANDRQAILSNCKAIWPRRI